MKTWDEKVDNAKQLKLTTIAVAIGWITIILAAASWNIWSEYKHHILIQPRNAARSSFARNITMRLWFASHGGIYVPISDTTPPNPYLANIPDRDAETPSGKKLTLMNPAYAIRHYSEYAKDLDATWHITSLNLLNPDNHYDEWEKKALQAFEQGAEEVFEFADFKGKPHLRLMKPLKYEKRCQKCHGQMGYKLGDIRGGMGAYFSMEKSWQFYRDTIKKLITTFLTILISGLLLIGFIYLKQKKSREEKDRLKNKQQQMDEDLWESEKQLRNLLESTSTVPWEIDLGSGKFTYIGKQVESMLGYPVDWWKDLNTWKNSLHPDDRENAINFCESETKEGKDHDFVYRAIHQDGSYRWIRDIVSVVPGDTGPEKLVGFMHNITEQKNLSQEKEELESQLRQVQKMEAIGTLAGGIAHDFNNILSIILGYTDLAKEDAATGTLLIEDLDKIEKAGLRAKDLVQQILSFSRQPQIEKKPLNPQPIFKETLKMLRSSIPTTIEIQQNISADCGTIDADPTQLHQILMNLCTNAFQAMEKNGGVLAVDLKIAETIPREFAEKLLDDEEVFLELTVSDSGKGIGSDTIDRIFDPFFTTKEQGKGTGMGLAIIYGIVKSRGGTITVDSQLGEGTTFHVYLPQSKQITTPIASAENTVVQEGRERILFVDDEKMITKMGKVVLERLGYQVTAKQSSLEALSSFENHPDNFDLVITDQTMPGMTGLDLARRMLQIRPDIPIILCTGYSSLVSEDVAKSQGIKGYFLKPITKSGLSRLIRQVLDKNNPAI